MMMMMMMMMMTTMTMMMTMTMTMTSRLVCRNKILRNIHIYNFELALIGTYVAMTWLAARQEVM